MLMGSLVILFSFFSSATLMFFLKIEDIETEEKLVFTSKVVFLYFSLNAFLLFVILFSKASKIFNLLLGKKKRESCVLSGHLLLQTLIPQPIFLRQQPLQQTPLQTLTMFPRQQHNLFQQTSLQTPTLQPNLFSTTHTDRGKDRQRERQSAISDRRAI